MQHLLAERRRSQDLLLFPLSSQSTIEATVSPELSHEVAVDVRNSPHKSQIGSSKTENSVTLGHGARKIHGRSRLPQHQDALHSFHGPTTTGHLSLAVRVAPLRPSADMALPKEGREVGSNTFSTALKKNA